MKINGLLIIVFVFLLSSLIRRSHGGTKSPCPQSMDTTSFHITRCPQDRKEKEDRSKTFKCEDQKQNCTTAGQYKYHCVLNSKGDGYIELCAPEVEIIGRRCTEFTTGGKFLQEHLESKCATCPFKYKSSECYKYNECYKLEFPRTLSSIIKEKTTESSKNKYMFTVRQINDRSMNDAVEDTENTFSDVGSEDGANISFLVIIMLACIILTAVFVSFVVYKFSLHKNMCNKMQRRMGERTPDVNKHETENFSTEAI